MKDKKLLTVLKGMIVGGTMLVPGCSGGSMAMILGVYNQLVTSVSSFFKHKRQSALFLALFALGGGVGMLLFAKPLLRLIERFPMPMLYLFLGAVAGSVPLVFRQARVHSFSWKIPVYIVLGLVAVFLIAALPTDIFQSQRQAGLTSSLLLALAGVIAAVALVLPGISISYLLLVMGLYDEIMRAIGDFYLPFLIPFGVGLILGVVLTTRLLERAMNRHPLPTYLIILGFMFGSMVEVFPGIPPWPEVLLCLVTLAAGFVAIRLLSRKEERAAAAGPDAIQKKVSE